MPIQDKKDTSIDIYSIQAKIEIKKLKKFTL